MASRAAEIAAVTDELSVLLARLQANVAALNAVIAPPGDGKEPGR